MFPRFAWCSRALLCTYFQDGSTAFMWAARQGHAKMLKRVWKAGKGTIDVNRVDDVSSAPLLHSVHLNVLCI